MRNTRMMLTGLAVVMVATWASAAGPFDAWPYSAKVTFAGYTRPETLTNVPMLVVLGPATVANFGYGQFLSGTNDLRFTDASGTELNYEIDKWDTTSNSYVWVQVPQLVDSNTYVQAWWGMTGQTAQAYTTNGATWTNGYRAVWHMNATSPRDSTTNHFNGTGGNVTLNNNGVVGSALNFNGSSAYVQLTGFSATGGRYTFEVWGQTTSATLGMRAFDSQTGRILLTWNDDTAGRTKYTGITGGVGANLNNGTWQQTAYVLDNSSNTGLVYQAGALVGSGSYSVANLGGGSTCIGSAYFIGATYFYGSLDEFRISTALRSSNWLWACWMNTASNAVFNAYTYAYAGVPLVKSLRASDILDTSATLNGSLTATGRYATAVSVYWGSSDGGTNAANWTHTNDFGTVTGPCPVALATNITGLSLSAGNNYWYRYAAAYSDGVAWSDPQSFGTVTWTGGAGGAGTSWNVGANWTGGAVPVPGATAVFTDTGLTANKIISLDVSQTIYEVTIATTTAFTLGNATDTTAGNSLTLVNVTRQDVTGTEGNHTIAAPLVFADNSVWDVAGSGSLIVTSKTVNAGGLTLEKRGVGNLQIGGVVVPLVTSPVTFSGMGKTTVSAGAQTLIDANNSMGSVDIGGAGSSATLNIGNANATHEDIADTAVITVKTQGLFYLNQLNGLWEHLGTVAVQAGGRVTLGTYAYSFIQTALNMSGGNVNESSLSTLHLYGCSVTHNGDVESVIEGVGYSATLRNYQTFTVNDGAAPVDMVIRLRMADYGTGGNIGGIDKLGGGVLSLENYSTFSHASGVTVDAGMLLVNNPAGSSGTGKQKVTVNAGATLGGIGFIGGVATNYTAANVTLTGSSAALATIAPGNINSNNGSHIIGTLTVGSPTYTNNVTFSNYGQLLINCAGNSSNDQLVVNGRLTLTTNNTLTLVNAGTLKGGAYTLVTAMNGISGTFNTMSNLPSRATITYEPSGTPTAVKLNMPSSGSIVLFR